MQRVRQSLPYLKENGWEPTIISVDERFVEAYSIDNLLLKTFPEETKVYKVSALRSSFTRKFGIGSLSLRSFFQIRKKGDELLKKEHFDLIYFSTTAFHVMALGPRWKKKFKVPFILDIQDPWYNTFYFENALQKKTAKAKIFHKVDKFLEAKTVPFADGIVCVSSGYRDMYLQRYPVLSDNCFKVIPFGCATIDFPIAEKYVHSSKIKFSTTEKNIVYIGRGGHDMEFATEIIFDAINLGLKSESKLFSNVRLWFIGTSYAPAAKGVKTIEHIAKKKKVGHLVTEITDRIPYFETLYLLSKADILFVPGSSDPTYTASKIFPYIYTNKPMLAIFHKQSSVNEILKTTNTAKVLSFGTYTDEDERQKLAQEGCVFLRDALNQTITNSALNHEAFEGYTARSMVKQQSDFFEEVIARTKATKN